MRPRVRPLEVLNLAALLLLTALTLAIWDRLENPARILKTYLGLAGAVAIVLLLTLREERLKAPLRFAVNFYPAAFLPIFFNTLGPVIAATRGPARDEILVAADQLLFGVDVTVWLERFVHPFWNDFFYIAYATYYFLGLTLGFLLWARDKTSTRRCIFTLVLCYYVSYALYFTIPALGPRYALAGRQTVSIETTPISASIARSINALEKTKLDVFPSGHTMVAVTILMISWRRLRRAFWFFLPIAFCLILSTVYCRYHYVVDVLAGILLALPIAPLGDRLYDRWAADPS